MSIRTLPLIFWAVLASLIACGDRFHVAAQEAVSKQRTFDFSYGAKIKELPDEANVRVWFPVAKSDSFQTAAMTSFIAEVDSPTIARDAEYGNSIGYFEFNSSEDIDESTFQVDYRVSRQEAGVDLQRELPAEQKARFLAANRLVPIDGQPTELLKDELPSDPAEAGAKLYDLVERHMKYDKSKPGYGKGDAVWACNSKTGNCTDFHSLFISLARSRSLPARFEIGFPLPPGKSEGVVKGYHCWAWFFAEGKGWVPVDISEADKHPEMKDYYFGKLTPDRVAFSTGRDITLVPKSASGPLNYFVYPHVEVDSKPWPKEKIDLTFSFKDVGTESTNKHD